MLVTNHVLSGAVIGAATRRPVSAFALGVVSHFVLDAVPHWGKWRAHDQFMRVAVVDGLTGLAVMGAMAAIAPGDTRVAVLAGMAGAALPDIGKPSVEFFGRSPFPRRVDEFHRRIQQEAPHRFPQEAATGVVLLAATITLLRARVRRR
ncbi:hypothetical protein EAS64_41425 [Trebonia kvetii]|uniref:Uncharacterized protein n=1 Tax=Trebonia kvetii TaxID=2480626 RepID=A0A6P2BNM5_9ACTN|nr:hypothetical protein [Trebonia kvetii]TVY99712.1 hypothetical protein EAS64_41425 [Trebonia kvetii]